MASILEHLAARIGFVHANRVYGRFLNALRSPLEQQNNALDRALRLVRTSDFGKRHRLDRVHTPQDLRRAVPISTYEDYRPYVERVARGETRALFSRGERILMFATSSGTTALPKWVPVTRAFVDDYRRGWNTFGLKMLSDHPRAVLRDILQSSGRYDESHADAGIPVGAITGLLAKTQKRIVRRFYVGRPEIAHLATPEQRYYALMRLGIVRDVAFGITANPATLIQLARTVDTHREAIIRDVRDGTVSAEMIDDAAIRHLLERRLQPAPDRARELDALCARHDALRPRDYWRVEFLACWTGGSMGHYLDRLRSWWGDLPIRDVGLLASEGRVSLPLEDNTPVGVLDVTAGLFEFIPQDQAEAPEPETLLAHELEDGQDYVVVLSNTTGLLRYRLDDVVRVHGRFEQTPLIEFLHRAGRVASVAGEKLTENQVVAAVSEACRTIGRGELDFILGPCWDDPPYYRLSCVAGDDAELAEAVDAALCAQNEEYASRRKSLRLGAIRIRAVPPDAIMRMDERLMLARRGTAEQYKRPCLCLQPGDDDKLLKAETA